MPMPLFGLWGSSAGKKKEADASLRANVDAAVREGPGPGSPAYVTSSSLPVTETFSELPPASSVGSSTPAGGTGATSSFGSRTSGDCGEQYAGEPWEEGAHVGNPQETATASFTSTTTHYEWRSYNGEELPDALAPAQLVAGALDAEPLPTHGPNETASFGSTITQYEWPTYPGARGEDAAFSAPAPEGATAQRPAVPMPSFGGYPGSPAPGANAELYAQWAAQCAQMAQQYAQMATLAASQDTGIAACGGFPGIPGVPFMVPQAAGFAPGDKAPSRKGAGKDSGKRNDGKRRTSSDRSEKPALPGAQATLHSSTEATQVKEKSEWVTIMLRNLPNDYSRDTVIELLDSHDFTGCYDFVYLPVDFKKGSSLGYVFVNMVSHESALRVFDKLQGFKDWKLASQKVCEVAWGSAEQQGLEYHIARYRNSPLMHSSVPEEFKPVIFHNGDRIAFPAPTKAPRKPRLKKHPRTGCRSPSPSGGSAQDVDDAEVP